MSNNYTGWWYLDTSDMGGMRGLGECIGALDGDSGGNGDREYRTDLHSQPQVAQALMQSSVEEFQEEPDGQISMNGISWIDRDWLFDVGREWVI